MKEIRGSRIKGVGQTRTRNACSRETVALNAKYIHDASEMQGECAFIIDFTSEEIRGMRPHRTINNNLQGETASSGRIAAADTTLMRYEGALNYDNAIAISQTMNYSREEGEGDRKAVVPGSPDVRSSPVPSAYYSGSASYMKRDGNFCFTPFSYKSEEIRNYNMHRD